MYFTAMQIVDENFGDISQEQIPKFVCIFFTQFGRLWDWDSLRVLFIFYPNCCFFCRLLYTLALNPVFVRELWRNVHSVTVFTSTG